MDGKTYGLPKDWGTLGLVYLPEAFADAGIDEPQPLKPCAIKATTAVSAKMQTGLASHPSHLVMAVPMLTLAMPMLFWIPLR